MRRHRFYRKDFVSTHTLLEGRDITHQVSRVLRMKTGEEIVIWNGDGKEYVFMVETISAKGVRGRVARIEENTSEPSVRVTLYCALLKRENFETVCQKATEAGVSGIVPLMTERTVKVKIHSDRVRKIIQEAAEQSGRARIPVLCDAMSFSEALKTCEGIERVIFFDTAQNDISHDRCLPGPQAGRKPDVIRDPLAQGLGMAEIIHIFIGPEGGWSDTERAAAQKAGLDTRSLGPLTLRAETAAIVASYLAAHGL